MKNLIIIEYLTASPLKTDFFQGAIYKEGLNMVDCLTQELIKPLSIIAGAIEDILSELLPGKTPLPIKFNQRAVEINKLLTETSNLMHAIKPPEWQADFSKISTAFSRIQQIFQDDRSTIEMY